MMEWLATIRSMRSRRVAEDKETEEAKREAALEPYLVLVPKRSGESTQGEPCALIQHAETALRRCAAVRCVQQIMHVIIPF